ncbi:MAG: hypothetical protein IK041_04530 [Bacteroidales bacterium]|nr:hypothetical protein [Bacteroidales bacterium]
MDNKKFPELSFLLESVAKKWNKRIATPKDFELLSEEISSKSSESISASTLKRIWGYDNYKSSPSIRMLDVLAKYAGSDSFRSFCNGLKKNPAFVSGFLTTGYIESSELEKGNHIQVGWNPNRLVELEFLGDSRYKVVSNCNSKLREGDEFELSAFIQGFPMYISHILRNGEKTSMYAAGIKDGLTLVQRLQ